MSALLKLLGPRKPATANAIVAEIDARQAALAAARETVEAAARSRLAALNDFDPTGVARAETMAAEGRIAVEIGAKAIEVLTAAHAARVEADRQAAALACKHALDERMTALIARRAEWAAATATIATMIAEAGALARDRVEAAHSATVEVNRGLPLHESVASVDRLFGGSLSTVLTLPESAGERQTREAQEESARRREERAAESARLSAERAEAFKAERLAEREEQDSRERNRYFPLPWREALKDAGR